MKYMNEKRGKIKLLSRKVLLQFFYAKLHQICLPHQLCPAHCIKARCCVCQLCLLFIVFIVLNMLCPGVVIYNRIVVTH